MAHYFARLPLPLAARFDCGSCCLILPMAAMQLKIVLLCLLLGGAGLLDALPFVVLHGEMLVLVFSGGKIEAWCVMFVVSLDD